MINKPKIKMARFNRLLTFLFIGAWVPLGLASPPDRVSGGSSIIDSTTIQTMLKNLDVALPGVVQFLIGLCYLMGLSFMVAAVWRLKKFGHRTAFMHTETGLVAPLVLFLMGALLLYTPGLFEIFNYTLFQQSQFQNITDWELQHTGGSWASVLMPMLQLIQVIGLISFVRGWLLLSRATNTHSQPGNASKGIIHVVAGILGMNITRTIDLISNSLGI